MIILWRQSSAVIKQMTDQAQKGPLRVTPTLKQRQMLKGDKNPGPRANEAEMMNLHNQKRVDAWINAGSPDIGRDELNEQRIEEEEEE